jgi:phosphate-selective porin OprO/OprP
MIVLFTHILLLATLFQGPAMALASDTVSAHPFAASTSVTVLTTASATAPTTVSAVMLSTTPSDTVQTLLIDETAQANIIDDIRFPTLPYYSYRSGLGLTSPDSTFRLNIRFRMQNRASFSSRDNADDAVEGVVRRLRLRFDGFVGDPRFLYAIQLSFAPGDVGALNDGDNLNIIRDAMFFYRPNNRWNIGFGQTKLPGNRQRVNSSGALQLTDRSINNAQFTIDRDYGVQLYYLRETDQLFGWNVKTAISTGEGRNWTASPSTHLAYTGRLELFPLGAFTEGGWNFEGDLKYEQTPKLMVAGTWHFNESAQRTRGQLGDILYEDRDMTSLFADVMLKYRGWSAMWSYMSRISDNPVTYDWSALPPGFTPQSLMWVMANLPSRHVFVGEGMDYQLSYLLGRRNDIVVRHSWQHPHSDIQTRAPKRREYSAGLTHYVWEHTFKIQGEVTWQQEERFNGDKLNGWYARFQIEIGI